MCLFFYCTQGSAFNFISYQNCSLKKCEWISFKKKKKWIWNYRFRFIDLVGRKRKCSSRRTNSLNNEYVIIEECPPRQMRKKIERKNQKRKSNLTFSRVMLFSKLSEIYFIFNWNMNFKHMILSQKRDR